MTVSQAEEGIHIRDIHGLSNYLHPRTIQKVYPVDVVYPDNAVSHYSVIMQIGGEKLVVKGKTTDIILAIAQAMFNREDKEGV